MSEVLVFNTIKSKEINVRGYIHSENSDGTFNICFNMASFNPNPKHLHRYSKDYLEKFYKLDGTTTWRIK